MHPFHRSLRDPLRRLALLAALVLGAPAAHGGVVPDGFVDELVAGDLAGPVNFDFLPDGRLLVVEQVTARIRVVVPGAPVQPPPVGQVDDVRIRNVEDGLLGIAVDPRWPARPYVYVHHVSASTPNIKVARFALTGDLAFTGDGSLTLDSLSRRDVLSDLPNDNWLHNGGTLLFGPDGYLYVALGDDGVPCLAQDIHQLRGKILRLDVGGISDGPGPVWPYAFLVAPGNPFAADPDVRARLVWHRGLRNPWTFAFDPRSEAMAIADVGESAWEEVDVTMLPGRNFGWPVFEAHTIFMPECPGVDLENLTLPVYAYPHASPEGGWTVILGGFVAPAESGAVSFPADYWGDLFLLDFQEGWLRRLEEVGGTWQPAPEVPGQAVPYAWGQGFQQVPRMRFGVDGALWYLQGDQLRRISSLVEVGVAGPAAELRPRLEAFPTPSTGRVTFEFALAREGFARLEVFDARGRIVRRLGEERRLAAGVHRAAWDGLDAAGRDVPAGVYFATLAAGGEVTTRRIVRIRG